MADDDGRKKQNAAVHYDTIIKYTTTATKQDNRIASHTPHAHCQLSQWLLLPLPPPPAPLPPLQPPPINVHAMQYIKKLQQQEPIKSTTATTSNDSINPRNEEPLTIHGDVFVIGYKP